MSTITNDLKQEKRPDGEMEVSYHTKPPCLRAVHLGRQRVSEMRPKKKILDKSFNSEGSVRIGKSCDLVLEKAALGLRPATLELYHVQDLGGPYSEKCDRVGKSHIFTTPTPLLVKTSLLMC